MPVRSPCISFALRQQSPFLTQALKTLPSPGRPTSGKTPAQSSASTKLVPISHSLKPGLAMNTPGHQQGHQPHWKKEGTRNGKWLIYYRRLVQGQKEDSAQAFAPVATGFQHLLLLQKMPGTGDGISSAGEPKGAVATPFPSHHWQKG